MSTTADSATIAGISESVFGQYATYDTVALLRFAAHDALGDAGISFSDVDGLLTLPSSATGWSMPCASVALVMDGNISLTGSFPTTTHGGLLCGCGIPMWPVACTMFWKPLGNFSEAHVSDRYRAQNTRWFTTTWASLACIAPSSWGHQLSHLHIPRTRPPGWKVSRKGRGILYSYTLVHRSPSPACEKDVPHVIAIVTLTEGPHIVGRLEAKTNELVRQSMPERGAR